jgi:outer membrane cobalamin receptor
MMSTAAFAQTGSIKGIVLDDTNQGLTGASVVLKGTTKGSITDLNGAYQVDGIPTGTQTIVISFIGFSDIEKTVEITNGSTIDMGSSAMVSESIGLNEVMVIASVAIDRKTPVAVSSIKSAQIEAKIGSQEFPEILKSTPGVFATKGGGGWGDGRINVRGFNDENVAVLINGIPVNDMENGNVYWSNWAGLTDAASSIQVQRGLGASKVAVPSVGGTINILSKASDRKKGGSLKIGTGNNGYSKVGFSLSSGLTDDGWAFTISGAKTQGDGFIDGTNFLGYSYFTNITKQINSQHELAFTLVGAKQTHGQRFNRSSLEDIEKNPRGVQYNPDFGYKDGQLYNMSFNFYHKPQMSLNHYWSLSDKTELATSVYASFGKGGGRRNQGDLSSSASWVRTGGQYGPVDVDHYVDANVANQGGESTAWIAASRNAHNWYGVLSTLNHELNENLTLLGGLDLRSYTGLHYYEVTDLLGGTHIINDDNVNNTSNVLVEGDRYNRDYEGKIFWTGVFGQLEYSKDQLAAFVSMSASNTSYKKEDFQRYLASDPNRESELLNFLGYQVKGGANYNLDDNHNVYANVGFFTKAPAWDNVFAAGDQSTEVNENAANEKIFSAEVGYGLRKSGLTANVNVYRTQWTDRALQRRFTDPVTSEIFYANVLGVSALHQGIEFDASYRVNPKLKLTGMLSLGDWTWTNDVENVYIRDLDGNNVGNPINVFIEGLKVGDAAQTTAALGFDYTLLEGLSVGMDYNYYDNLYAGYSPTARSSVEQKVDAWQLPAYGLLDLNIAYKFEISGLKSSLYGNINNIANTQYIADASDGPNHDALTSSMYSGFGTTWTLGATIKF